MQVFVSFVICSFRIIYFYLFCLSLWMCNFEMCMLFGIACCWPVQTFQISTVYLFSVSIQPSIPEIFIIDCTVYFVRDSLNLHFVIAVRGILSSYDINRNTHWFTTQWHNFPLKNKVFSSFNSTAIGNFNSNIVWHV